MKFSFAVLSALNLLVCGVSIGSIFYRPAAPKNFDTGVARIAVREQLANLAFLKRDANLRITQGCAEQRGAGGFIVGSGETLNQISLIEGVPMNQSMRFSYQAAVSANCGAYNLHCYKVNSIDINGSNTLSPRL